MRQTGVAQPPGATRIGKWTGRILPVPGFLAKSYPAHMRGAGNLQAGLLSRGGVGNSPKAEEGNGREPPCLNLRGRRAGALRRPNRGFRWMAKDGTQIGDDGRGGGGAPGATPSCPPHRVEPHLVLVSSGT